MKLIDLRGGRARHRREALRGASPELEAGDLRHASASWASLASRCTCCAAAGWPQAAGRAGRRHPLRCAASGRVHRDQRPRPETGRPHPTMTIPRVPGRAPLVRDLVSNPNCSRPRCSNLLTGARQKVANYAGVTVERKVGSATLRDGRTISVVDLPGATASPGHAGRAITLEVIEGRPRRRGRPDADRRRGRCHQPAHEPAPGAGARRLGRDDRRAQHGRRGALARPGDRRGSALAQSWAAGGRDGGDPPPRPRCAAGADRRARRHARRRPRHRQPAARDRPTAARGAPHPRHRRAAGAARQRRATPSTPWCCTRVGLLLLATLLFIVFQAVFSWATAHGRHQGRHGRARRVGTGAHGRRARCAACWSTA